MKRIIVAQAILLILGLIACNGPANEEKQTEVKIDNIDWLLGDWERVDEVEGKRTYEMWITKNPGVYLGYGITLLNVDTVFEERMKIYKPKNDWVLEVSGVNEEPTVFTFTNLTNNSFASYCSENEFPKKIEYFLEQDYLRAIISDDITKIPFKFRRADNL